MDYNIYGLNLCVFWWDLPAKCLLIPCPYERNILEFFSGHHAGPHARQMGCAPLALKSQELHILKF